MTPENEIKKAVLEFLKLKGIPAWRQNAGGRTWKDKKGKIHVFKFASVKGISDVIGLLPPHGRMLAIETKVEPRKATKDQQEFLDMVNAAGGLGIVAYTLDDVMEVLP